jgi:hypothetical protein
MTIELPIPLFTHSKIMYTFFVVFPLKSALKCIHAISLNIKNSRCISKLVCNHPFVPIFPPLTKQPMSSSTELKILPRCKDSLPLIKQFVRILAHTTLRSDVTWTQSATPPFVPSFMMFHMVSFNWSIVCSIGAFDTWARSIFTSSKPEMSSPGKINPPISTTPSPLVIQSDFSLSLDALELLSNKWSFVNMALNSLRLVPYHVPQ